MDTRPSVEVLDLASTKPVHRRTQSKTSILKALISPVKSPRKPTSDRHDTTPSLASPSKSRARADDKVALGSVHENRAARLAERQDDAHVYQTRTTKIPLQPSSETEAPYSDSPSKRLKENVDPFTSSANKQLLPMRHAASQGSFSSSDASSTRRIPTLVKRGAKVMAAVAAIQSKSTIPVVDHRDMADPSIIEAEFEAMLAARNVAPHMREQMRNLTLRVKADLVRQENVTTPSSPSKDPYSREPSTANDDEDDAHASRSTKRSRPRSRTFTFSRSDKVADSSPSKRQRGRSKSRAEADARADLAARSPSKPRAPSRSATARTETPETYISYLKAQPDPTKLEVGRLHKLRILLRNETVGWVDAFIAQGGMSLMNDLLMSIMKIEWREEHEDQLLHETLLCLKGLCTTGSALTELEKYADVLLTSLLAMLFDPDRKGPAEYSTRMVIINVLFSYLSCKTSEPAEVLQSRAQKVLSYMSQQSQGDDAQPLSFVLDMRTPRPYQAWAKEVTNVTREVFWIFLHQLNVIPLDRPSTASSDRAKSTTFLAQHFPGARPPVPAAPYIGGVEWDAAMYLTAHLDLLNGLVAALPTQADRNELRKQLQLSGFERTMGTTLRTCKEKFYAGIHDGLRAWARAAADDDWPTLYVREGPSLEEQAKSARSSPQKSGKKQPPPKLDEVKVECPVLDFNVQGMMNNDNMIDGWLE